MMNQFFTGLLTPEVAKAPAPAPSTVAGPPVPDPPANLFVLRYRIGIVPDDLAPGECTVRGSSLGERRWWNLWLCVARDTDGKPDLRAIPVNPNGEPTGHDSAVGFAWGLKRTTGGWVISPSIAMKDDDPTQPPDEKPRRLIDVWHKNAIVVGAPEREPWTKAGA